MCSIWLANSPTWQCECLTSFQNLPSVIKSECNFLLQSLMGVQYVSCIEDKKIVVWIWHIQYCMCFFTRLLHALSLKNLSKCISQRLILQLEYIFTIFYFHIPHCGRKKVGPGSISAAIKPQHGQMDTSSFNSQTTASGVLFSGGIHFGITVCGSLSFAPHK